MKKRTHAIDDLVARYGAIPANLLIDRACPTCGAAEGRSELAKDHMQLVRCTECDLVFVNPAFDEQHYREVYQSADYQEIMRDLGERSHEYRVDRFGKERVEIMARHLVSHDVAPSYLDVGCSTGFVVEAAAHRGWNAQGIDLNPSAIEYGQRRGLNLKCAALEDLEAEAGSFDAVSLFDVLEHLLHPRRTLDAAVRLLAPGGLLFVYVPNYDSASRLLMGAAAHFIWPTHHLNYYTPVTIAALMQRAGLEVVDVSTEGLDFEDYLWHQREVHRADVSAVEPIASTLQFLANAGAYGKNLRMLARKPEAVS
jgi:2-polyprenyl-3-methyl-5-hydroxy-6-metoxy-1,4-benzoquinol methylase